MKTYTGTCRGGPLDGQEMANVRIQVQVPIRAVPKLSVAAPADRVPVEESIKLGRYFWINGIWEWFE